MAGHGSFQRPSSRELFAPRRFGSEGGSAKPKLCNLNSDRHAFHRRLPLAMADAALGDVSVSVAAGQ